MKSFAYIKPATALSAPDQHFLLHHSPVSALCFSIIDLCAHGALWQGSIRWMVAVAHLLSSTSLEPHLTLVHSFGCVLQMHAWDVMPAGLNKPLRNLAACNRPGLHCVLSLLGLQSYIPFLAKKMASAAAECQRLTQKRVKCFKTYLGPTGLAIGPSSLCHHHASSCIIMQYALYLGHVPRVGKYQASVQICRVLKMIGQKCASLASV